MASWSLVTRVLAATPVNMHEEARRRRGSVLIKRLNFKVRWHRCVNLSASPVPVDKLCDLFSPEGEHLRNKPCTGLVENGSLVAAAR